jgi:hypothetical protein
MHSLPGKRKIMKRFFLSILFLAAGCLLSNPGYATINILPNDMSSPLTIKEVNPYDVNGSQMAGMLVTFTYLDQGGAQHITPVIWVADPGNGGYAEIVFGTGNNKISLVNSNDTFLNPWNATVTNNADGVILQDIKIDGLPGNVVFDRSTFGVPPVSDPAIDKSNGNINGQENFTSIGGTDLTPYFGTAGSYRGVDAFELNSDFKATANAQYSGPAQIGAAAPVGDIFRFLDIDFTGGGQQLGLLQKESFNFEADTDKVVLPGGGGQVPVPPTVWLLGSGLLGLGLMRWRRKEQ